MIKKIISYLFPTTIPRFCDKCKNPLEERFVSCIWGDYNYICIDCYAIAKQHDEL